VPVFVDTNVLVYARDASDPERQATAAAWIEHLWTTAAGRLSIQVLQEYYVTTTRKLDPGLPSDEARQDVRDLAAWRPVRIDEAIVEAAWRLEDRYELSFWDSLIVAAAQAAACEALLTEDLQHGLDIDGLRIADPFQTEVGSLGWATSRPS
jgi:predicted nucleic acid-binding protein